MSSPAWKTGAMTAMSGEWLAPLYGWLCSEHVAGAQLDPALLDRLHHPLRVGDERADVQRRVVGLGDLLAARVQQRAAHVLGLADEHGARAADELVGHLLGDRVQLAADDLQQDRVDRRGSSARSSGRRQADVPSGGDDAVPAGRDHDGRVHLVHDRGAGEPSPARRQRAVVGRHDCSACPSAPPNTTVRSCRSPRPPGRRRRPGPTVCGRVGIAPVAVTRRLMISTGSPGKSKPYSRRWRSWKLVAEQLAPVLAEGVAVDRQLVALAGVAAGRLAVQHRRRRPAAKRARRSRSISANARSSASRSRLGQHDADGADAVVLQVGGQQAHRRRDAGRGRQEDDRASRAASATSHACSGPAPPKATSAHSRGS